MPNDVRGPILTGWGIRGSNSARRDDDEKVRAVVHDAFVAGDVDDAKFESGVTAQLLVDWVPLSDWWTFWRKGKLTGTAIRKALATARELALIDDAWFFENLEGRGGRLKGTDVVCDTLSKEQVVAWLKNVHASRDGSPAGLVSALGWETILQKTAEDALLFALDAFAKKAGLVAPPESKPEEKPEAEKITVEPTAAIDESPKLAEARAAMLKMLNQPAPEAKKAWDESEVPGRPSSLEWPESPVPADVGSVDIIPVTEDDSVPAIPVAPAAAKGKPPAPAPNGAKKAPLPRTR